MKTIGPLVFAGCVLLSACSYGPQDEQIRGDFLAFQQKEGLALPAEIKRITREDGWSDGAEVRVYFCLRTQKPPAKCDETYVGMSYQKYADDWRLISTTSERVAHKP
jgi:hypothetical protein